MRSVLRLLVAVGLVACGGDKAAIDGGGSAAADAGRVSDGATADVSVATGSPDASTSNCIPATGCGDAGICWKSPAGDHLCSNFTPASYGPSQGDSCDGGVKDPFGRPPPGTCCSEDSHCTAGPRGRCLFNTSCGGVAPPPGRHCDYTGWCTGDAECMGGLCIPGAIAGADKPVCLSGSCRTNADCNRKSGGRCQVASAEFCVGFASLYCSYPDDVCQTGPRGGTCPQGADPRGLRCVPNDDGHGTKCVQHPGFPP
jgi:hypothetical protein